MADPPRDDPFFIGWLPVPRATRAHLWGVAVFAVQLAIGSALLLSAPQRSPGPAAWDDAPASVEGIAYVSPYPMIRVAGDPVRTVLLVDGGKFGAAARVTPVDGQPVRVTGTVLHRDGRQMLELAAGSDAIQPVSMSESQALALRRPPPRDRGPVALAGEIVDSKCYLGAMKPGGGKTHKGCAVLCLRGGVPPMFVTRDGERRETFYLLTGPDGGPVGEEILPFVGDPVTVRGRVESVGDLLLLSAAADGVRRR